MYPNPPNPPHPPYPYPPPPRKKGLSTGAIVAIVLGSVFVLGATVAVILGVTAAKSFTKYAEKSRTAEARVNLRRAMIGAEGAYEEFGKYPESAGVTTPPLGACCAQGGKCLPEVSLWAEAPWVALGFAVEDPHLYSYTYVSDGAGFTVRAHGDLDCDGVYSTFEMTNTRALTIEKEFE